MVFSRSNTLKTTCHWSQFFIKSNSDNNERLSTSTESKTAMYSKKIRPLNFFPGYQPAKGLWGIKHTRKPVDSLVAAAKNLGPDKILPFVKLQVTKDGLSFTPIGEKKGEKSAPIRFPVDTISYGVQDLVYTRVFSMIVVRDEKLKSGLPFICHAFVCESKNQARQVTYALAAAFQDYGKRVKEELAVDPSAQKKKFAIDLRSPEELEEALDDETEA